MALNYNTTKKNDWTMGSVFQKVMHSNKYFTDEAKAEIKQKLKKWSDKSDESRCLCDNIQSEQQLQLKSMVALLKTILYSQMDELEKKYEEECRKYLLKGKRIYPNDKRPKRYGVAIEKNAFVWTITRHFGFHINKDEINGFIGDLLLGEGINGSKFSCWKTIYLKDGQKHVWATWHENKKDDPFAFSKKQKAEEVRACLGLQRDESGQKELLLFTYTSSKKFIPKIPTIADAGLHFRFCPAKGQNCEYGRTAVNSKPDDIQKGYCLEGRPECIHKCIQLGKIEVPIRMYK